MGSGSVLNQALLYLGAMVLVVPVAKRLGLGAVLGYLIAGAVLGPAVLGWLGGGHGADGVLHFAEFGVVMMLFIIGLELRPALLWKMRGPIFGWGGLQVSLTAAAFLALSLALGVPGKEGFVIGLILAMSSTAIVIQTLHERGLLKTTGGEAAFSVLLFQDIAVIPILALIPLLAGSGAALAPGAAGSSWMQALRIVGAVASVFVCSRFLVRPVFRIVAQSHLREIFTALALLMVLATTVLMNAVGLSPALGAFMAGVMLADSEYRHQLEADIEPFKGLLLGLFFISVGAGLDLAAAAKEPLMTLALVLGLVTVKAAVLLAIAKLVNLPCPDHYLFAAALAQGGEFAFVLIGFAGGVGALTPLTGGRLSTAVALSMAVAPLLIGAYSKLLAPCFAEASKKSERAPDEIDEKDNPVIVAGFGRFGQTTTRLLRACGVSTTVLDFDAEQVEVLRRFGMKSFYGDASRMDLLRSAGIERAKVFIIAIDDKEKTTEIAKEVRKEFPHLKILARCYDRIHAFEELLPAGVDRIYIETSGSAIKLGRDALMMLGYNAKRALRASQIFERSNDRSITAMAKIYHEVDDSEYMVHSNRWVEELEKMLKTDIGDGPMTDDRAWESAPRSDV